MKNLFKYLSVAALVGSIGFSTMGVNAATGLTSWNGKKCEPNQTLKRDYYLFLDSNRKTRFTSIETGKVHTYTTSGNKANLVKNNTVLSKGSISINNNDNTEATTPNAEKSWTAKDYWTKYAVAVNNKDTRLVYADGDENYILHSGWDTWSEDGRDWVSRQEENKTANDRLNTYLTEHINNLDEIVSNGTIYPVTKFMGIPNTIGQESDNELTWQVQRQYTSKVVEGKDGISIPGNTENVVYSPFAYYVEYCVAGGSGEKDPDPEANKELKYVKNIDAEVTDMPTDETFEDKTKVSTSVPKATGYRFLGWSTKKEDTTADEKYKAGSEITESTTLYAIWQKSDGTFTVTYDANGGKNAPAKDSAKDGSCLKISDKKPTQTGFNFLGWSTKKDAQEPDKKYAAGADYCGDAGNVTLYAVWQTRTGVSAHLIAFGTVALAAVGALVVAKKKNLFRQI